jgi:16S rRNA processing protein RimM
MIGQVLRPHGVRGEVRVEPFTDLPERFEWLERIYVGEPPQAVVVDSVRFHQGTILLKLQGDDDRDAAEARRGQRLFVPEDEAIPLEEGEYFIHDLIGLKAFDDTGRSLGTLVEVLETGANNVFVIRGPLGELLLPDIPDVIHEIDFANSRLTIALLPGMGDAPVDADEGV